MATARSDIRLFQGETPTECSMIRYLHVYNLEVLDVGLYYRTYGHVEVVRHVTIRVEVCLYLCILGFISSCQWKIVCSWLADTGVAELRLESCMISKPMK